MPVPAGVPGPAPNTPAMAKAQAAPRVDSAAVPRPVRPVSPAAPAAGRTRRPAVSSERRRRAAHFRRRRRDLLVDAVAGLILAIILISVTAGLGILLLLLVPMAAGLIAQPIVQRRRARRSGVRPRRPGPRAGRR